MTWRRLEPYTQYMPKYDGWWITEDVANVMRAEELGRPTGEMAQLKRSNWPTFESAARPYPLYVWTPEKLENEFGPISP